MYIITLFFFNDTATTEIYTLSLHDALPISTGSQKNQTYASVASVNSSGITPNNKYDRYNFNVRNTTSMLNDKDRKSTRLNSSHANISYAVFCLKKKKNINNIITFK